MSVALVPLGTLLLSSKKSTPSYHHATPGADTLADA